MRQKLLLESGSERRVKYSDCSIRSGHEPLNAHENFIETHGNVGAFGLALTLSSCVNPYAGPNERDGAVVGAVGGGLLGAIVGNQSGRPLEGAAIGGVLGSLAGSSIGASRDQRYNGYYGVRHGPVYRSYPYGYRSSPYGYGRYGYSRYGYNRYGYSPYRSGVYASNYGYGYPYRSYGYGYGSGYSPFFSSYW